MPIDVQNSFKKVDDAAQVFPTYKRLRDDQKKLEKRVSKSFDKNENLVKTRLTEWSGKTQQFQENITTQFDELVKLAKLIKGAGSDSNGYIKKTFIKALTEVKPQLNEIYKNTIIKTLGCNTDLNLLINQPYYIKVKSIDFFDYLTLSANTQLGKLIYEKEDISYYTKPFPMNKCLYDRIQNMNQPLSAVAGTPFVGVSGQNLFDIEYVESYVNPFGQTITGNFYKVTFSQRAAQLNVDEFLNDYFKSIDLFDQKNFFTQLINIITGAIGMKQDTSKTQLSAFQKFLKIQQRILGLCYDQTPEIDVSGNAKVSERDLLDESFFEMSDLDLRLIDQRISDIKLSVVEFEDCDNIKVMVNTDAIIDGLSQINFVPGTNQTNELEKVSAIIYNANDGRFKLAYDDAWIKEFPKALVVSLLSPKNILPMMMVAKSMSQPIVDNTTTLELFTKNFKTFLIEFVSQVGAIFTRILFNIVKKDIKKLIKELTADILNEKKEKIKNMVFPLTVLGVGIGIKLLKDFRDCKSVVDDLTKILSLVLNKKISAYEKLGNSQDIPLPLLFSAKLLEGTSPTRSYMNVVQELEKIGVPTGPMPDGSPNEFLASIYAMIKGVDRENSENGKTAVAVGPLTVTPLFQTLPKKVYGKSF